MTLGGWLCVPKSAKERHFLFAHDQSLYYVVTTPIKILCGTNYKICFYNFSEFVFNYGLWFDKNLTLATYADRQSKVSIACKHVPAVDGDGDGRDHDPTLHHHRGCWRGIYVLPFSTVVESFKCPSRLGQLWPTHTANVAEECKPCLVSCMSGRMETEN